MQHDPGTPTKIRDTVSGRIITVTWAQYVNEYAAAGWLVA